MVLEKKTFKWQHPIFAFSWLFLLWREPGPSFEQTWTPFTQGWFSPSLVEFGPVVLEKKSKKWKVNGQTTNNRQSEKFTWIFGSGELKMQAKLGGNGQFLRGERACILNWALKNHWWGNQNILSECLIYFTVLQLSEILNFYKPKPFPKILLNWAALYINWSWILESESTLIPAKSQSWKWESLQKLWNLQLR